MLIKNKNHDRDISSTIDKIQSELDAQLDYNVTDFLAGIRSDKPRYARDQFRLLQSLLDKYGKEKLINAAKFCTENRLFSANTAKNFLKFSEFPKPEIRQIDNHAIPVDKPEYHVTVQKRSLSVYAKAGEM